MVVAIANLSIGIRVWACLNQFLNEKPLSQFASKNASRSMSLEDAFQGDVNYTGLIWSWKSILALPMIVGLRWVS